MAKRFSAPAPITPSNLVDLTAERLRRQQSNAVKAFLSGKDEYLPLTTAESEDIAARIEHAQRELAEIIESFRNGGYAK